MKTDVSAAFDLAARLHGLAEGFALAKQRSITKLARSIGPEANRDIRTEWNLTATRVRKGLTVRQTSTVVELVGSDVGIGLAQGYRARSTKAGLVVTIRNDEGPQRFRHAFLRIPGGRAEGTGVQAFERQGRRAPRYPVRRLFSQNVAGMLRDSDRVERLTEFSMKALSAEVERLLGVFRGKS